MFYRRYDVDCLKTVIRDFGFSPFDSDMLTGLFLEGAFDLDKDDIFSFLAGFKSHDETDPWFDFCIDQIIFHDLHL